MEINNYELKEIVGGGFNLGILSMIGAGIAFIIGLVDGYVRPLACRR